MRILRLRIENYRGIAKIDVRFSPRGITLIEGPNEAGKTSLAEAVRLLFEHPAETKKEQVRAVKPVHTDAGPEIELEAQCGSYCFVYRKRFLKKPETVLRVDQPRAENYTGREAHERAESILRETIDVDLWKALSISQGEEIRQADLSKQTALSAALDIAAGGPPTRPEEETLFGRATAEYGLYYTPGGAQGKQMQQALDSERRLGGEVADLDKRLNELQADTERSAVLREKERDLRVSHGELEAKVSGFRKALDEIRESEAAVIERASAVESSKADQRLAQHKCEERHKLIGTQITAGEKVSELTRRLELLQPSLAEVEDNLRRGRTVFDEAQANQREAESLFRLHSADLDYLHNRLDLQQVLERKSRIDEARRRAVEAQVVLSSNRVDEEALNRIKLAERQMITADARLQAGSPSLTIHALNDIRFAIDGEDVVMEKDATTVRHAAAETSVVFPGVAELKVAPGTSSEELSTAVQKASDTLRLVCEAVGVISPEGAREAHERRAEALRVIDQRKEVEKRDLRDLTYEELEHKVYGLEKRVPEYLVKRVKEPLLVEDFELARTAKHESETALQRANEALETAQRELEIIRSGHDRVRDEHQQLKVESELATRSLQEARENLSLARRINPDEELESQHQKATDAVRRAGEAHEAAAQSLREKKPDKVKTLSEAAEGSLRTLKGRLQSMQQELTEVRASLKAHGEDGLHEQLNRARSTLEHVRQENEALSRRAAAAKLLFETMRDERDATRRAYVAPLKEKIEHLGRLVFSDTFQVGIDDDLAMVNRTLEGVTVDFNDLSGGTREQLALIARLACALIVSADGGVPVILDDALGYTDPKRLELMGAVLSKASRECQIIILTCYPQRYAYVGDATIVRL